MLPAHLIEWKGISVKRFVLCAVLIAFVGAITVAQDGGPENKTDQGSESTLLTSVGSKSRWRLQPATLRRPPTPLFTFLEPSRTSTQLILQREHSAVDQAGDKLAGHRGFHWSTAINQSLLFLGVQHGYAMTQPKTRHDLRGSFFKDYIRSVKSLHGWEDGGRFFT